MCEDKKVVKLVLEAYFDLSESDMACVQDYVTDAVESLRGIGEIRKAELTVPSHTVDLK